MQEHEYPKTQSHTHDFAEIENFKISKLVNDLALQSNLLHSTTLADSDQVLGYSSAIDGWSSRSWLAHLWQLGVNNSDAMLLNQSGLKLASLSGTGSRMVVTDANGLLSSQAIPSGGGTTLPANSSGYLKNNGTGTLTYAFPSWTEVTGKPTFATVATSGSYADLTSKPTLFSGAYADLTGKPTLFSGAYADLTGKPTLFSGSYTDLTNKPTLFSGSYTDLTNKPTLGTLAALSPTGTANNTTYLRGDGTWATVSGGGGLTQAQADARYLQLTGGVLSEALYIGSAAGTTAKYLRMYQGPNGTAGQTGYVWADYHNVYLGTTDTGNIVMDGASSENKAVAIQEAGAPYQQMRWWFDGYSGTGTGGWFRLPSQSPSMNIQLGDNAGAGKLQIRDFDGNIRFSVTSQGVGSLAGKLSVGSLQVGTATTAGYVLTADATGNATWQAATGGGGGGITQTQADARYVQSGPNGTDAAPVFGYIKHSQNGAASFLGLYAEDNALYYGISASLPSPSGTSTLGGYYKGMGIGGSTSNTGNPIFGVLNSAQGGNGNNSTALTVYDDNRFLTFKNTLDDGAGKMSVLNLRIGTTSTVGYVWTATDAAGNGSWQVAASGGGGSYVDLTTNQEVGGRKTFTGETVITNMRYNANGFGAGKLLQSDATGYTSWITPTWITQAQGDARYLQLTGGTLTGDLTVTNVTASGRISSSGSMKLNTNSNFIYGSEDNVIFNWDGTGFTINPRNYTGTNTANVTIQSGLTVNNGLTIAASGLTINAQNIVTDTTTGMKIGTATGQKLGFFNATPVVQQSATGELGGILSNLGLRASGSAYPITTSGTVSLSGVLQANTSVQYGLNTVTAATTLTQTGSKKIQAVSNASTTAYALTLPVPAVGLTYTFVKSDANTNGITITASSGTTINGAATYSLAAQYKYVTIVGLSTTVWLIIANN